MKPNFMGKIANIITEIRIRTCINKTDTEVLENILQYELNEYFKELREYYDAGYDDGYANGKSSSEGDVESAYDEGYALGYDDGYSGGYYEGHSEV